MNRAPDFPRDDPLNNAKTHLEPENILGTPPTPLEEILESVVTYRDLCRLHDVPVDLAERLIRSMHSPKPAEQEAARHENPEATRRAVQAAQHYAQLRILQELKRQNGRIGQIETRWTAVMLGESKTACRHLANAESRIKERLVVVETKLIMLVICIASVVSAATSALARVFFGLMSR